MEPVLAVAGLWGLFIATHIGLSTSRIRSALLDRLGERRFLFAYQLLASVIFAALVGVYASVQDAGPRGLALAAMPLARILLIAPIAVGFALMVAALAPRGYFNSPAVVLTDRICAPYGLERITRHPFFVGIAIAMGSHALLATHLTGTVFCAGFVVLALIGPFHQTRKLRVRHGSAYDSYLARTSAVPFLAMAAGRQQFVASEMPWGTLVLGLAVAAAVYVAHDHLFAAYGAWLSLVAVAGTALIGLIVVRIREAMSPAKLKSTP
jgi:uncharacterized membrane protein